MSDNVALVSSDVYLLCPVPETRDLISIHKTRPFAFTHTKRRFNAKRQTQTVRPFLEHGPGLVHGHNLLMAKDPVRRWLDAIQFQHS